MVPKLAGGTGLSPRSFGVVTGFGCGPGEGKGPRSREKKEPFRPGEVRREVEWGESQTEGLL
jgi:hypothetical protein